MKRQKIRYSKLPGKERDSSEEETELYVKKVYTEKPTIEKVIQEGDTLQSLSIRYRCTIAELKRLNKMHKENEIFARNTIKVPVYPFSMIIAGVHESGSSSPNGKVPTTTIDESLLEDKLINIVPQSSLPSNDFNSVIFNSNLVLVKNCDNEEKAAMSDNENVGSEGILVDKGKKTPWSFSGADADISWIALIICVVVVIFAVPVIYVVYIAEHPESFQHIKSHINTTT